VKTFEGDIEVGGSTDAASDVDPAEDGMQITAQRFAILRNEFATDDS
jgi:hypothetical protein